MNWRCFFGRHDFELRRTLTLLGEVGCTRCERRWLYSAEVGGSIPWPKDADAFFERYEERAGAAHQEQT